MRIKDFLEFSDKTGQDALAHIVAKLAFFVSWVPEAEYMADFFHLDLLMWRFCRCLFASGVLCLKIHVLSKIAKRGHFVKN